jgi:c-di-GMP-binding flagellar brake protein YcgR
MAKEIPLKIEILSEVDDDRHRVISAKEIEFVMHHIAEKMTKVALYYDDANDFILTTLLAADETGLWLEQSPSGSVNKRITESNKLVFVSSHFQAKVQFTADHPSSVWYLGYPAFFLPLPDSLYRIQRREYFRLMTPVVNPLRCIIGAGKATSPKPPHEFIIMDISCGGVGLTCKESDTELTPGTSYPDCQIDLPEVGTIKGTIEVRNLVSLTSESGHTQCRAGCEFKNLDGASTMLLQRYITYIQRVKAKS